MEEDQARVEISKRISDSAWFRWMSILSVFGAILGLALAIPSVRDFAYDDGPRLNIRVASEIPVFGITQNVPGLDVIYAGKSLIESQQKLTALRITIENSGRKSITPSDVSNLDPIGFRISGGDIVRSQFSSTSAHLSSLARPVISQNSITVGSNIIIDPGDSMQFDILVLEGRDGPLAFNALGKIAGVERINIIKNDQESSPNSISEAVSGNLKIQMIRTIIYTLLSLVLVGLFITAIIQTSEFLSKLRREKRVKKSKNITNIDENIAKELDFVIKWYQEEGEEFINSLYKDALIDGKLDQEVRFEPELIYEMSRAPDIGAMHLVSGRFPRYFFIKEGKSAGFVGENGEVSVALKSALAMIRKL